MRDWFNMHDMVILSKTKSTASSSIPGFVAINNSKYRHGGVAILITRHLYPSVSSMDDSDPHHFPGIIPPPNEEFL